tara:strand:- start:4 stop:480 length:477 start_codon:yes stop_codon:yes gene_type:complete
MQFKYDFSVDSSNEEMTIKIGKIIGNHISVGSVVLLVGDLGAGKTKLTQGILNGLGCHDFVRSPTFVLITEYHSDFPIYHMDLYRLDTSESIDRLFLDEYLYGEGVCVIEWADKGNDSFPHDSLTINIESLSESSRRLNFQYNQNSFNELRENLKGKF